MRIAPAAMFFLLALVASNADARGVPIGFGWGSEVRTVGKVTRNSTLGRDANGRSLSVVQTWDQFWLVAPVWRSGRKYLVLEDLTNESQFWELKDQSPDEIAQLTGIPRSRLSFPWWSYVPVGWLIGAALVVGSRLLSGPTPARRFQRLWRDERYRVAVSLLAPAEHDGEDVEEPTAAEQQAVAEANWNNALAYLKTQGISQLTADRNLRFVVGYLERNP